MRTRLSPGRLLAAASLAAIAACSSAPSDDGARTTQSPILNGTQVPNAARSGYVQIHSGLGFLCSGMMLTPDWAITAAHCQLDEKNVGNNSVVMGNDGDPAQESARPKYIVHNGSLDMVLIQLDHRLDVPNDNRGIFTLGPSSLRGLQLTAYGYSDNQCTGDGCTGWGTLRSALLKANGQYDEYNFNVDSVSGQSTTEGDSGGPLVLNGPAGPVLTGTLKSGPFANTPNFRDWALSQIFDRPFSLPSVWFLPYSAHVYLAAHPLEDNFSNSVTYAPCPGSPSYDWQASYELDPAATITLSSDAGATTLAHPGAHYTNVTNGTASGPFTIAISSGVQAEPSPGLQSLTFSCHRGIQYTPPRVESGAATDVWDACPGGSYQYTASYNVPSGQTITLEGGMVLSGSGTMTQTHAPSPMTLAWTPGLDVASALTMTATCSGAIHCLGPECVSSEGTYGKITSRAWAPCGSGAFKWRYTGGFGATASLSMQSADGAAQTIDWTSVNNPERTTDWFYAAGPQTVTANGGAGVVQIDGLSAVCLDWHTPSNVGIHVVAGTYGARCGANPGNETADLAGFCDGQSSCKYTVDYQHIGDPFPGCAKDYTAQYTCNDSSIIASVTLAPEAGFGSVAALSCPSNPSSPSPACLASCEQQFSDCVDGAGKGLAFCRQQLTACKASCSCARTTCAAAGARCGTIADGCGGTIDCGGCGAGQACTSNNQCICAPTTCAAQGATCGSIADGCGGTLDCGGCGYGSTCSGNQCVCAPLTCKAGMCGTLSDGCGGTINCGACTCVPKCAGKRCGAGDGCGGTCSGTCAKAGWYCIDDGEGKYCGPG